MIKVPIVPSHSPELVRETGGDGKIIYRHPRGTEWNVCTSLSFWDIRVRYMGLLKGTLRGLSDELYLSAIGAGMEQLVNFVDQRFEEIEHLLDEHVGELEFHQIDRAECYGANCIIGLTVKPKASKDVQEVPND